MFHPKDLRTLREIVAWWRNNKAVLTGPKKRNRRQPRRVGGDARVKIGKADSGITYDSTGTVSIWRKNPTTGTLEDTTENETAYLDWMHGDVSISAGKEVVITWFADEQIWRVTGAECEG